MSGRPRNPERTRRDCQHPVARHQHGTFIAYVNDRCRCTPCTDANSAYVLQRRKQIAYGRLVPTYTDAAPVRDHIELLRAAGMGINTLAARANVANASLHRLIYGEKGKAPAKTITFTVAERVLALKPSLDLLAAGAMIDATGTRRRLQALVAIGWTQPRLARELGCTAQHVSHLLHYRGKTTAANARRIRDLYDRLWDQRPVAANQWELGGIHRALTTAAEHGWAVPLAWDDDGIDDPTATPDTGARDSANGGTPATTVGDNVEFLLEDNPLATAVQLAQRLGYRDSKGIQVALKRAGRRDLLDQLVRNADLARPGQANRKGQAA